MKIQRRFTQAGGNVYAQFDYTLRSSVLKNTNGSTVFQMDDIEVPKQWSQVATDILAQKYFRKAGVPEVDADGNAVVDETGTPKLGAERSIKQVVHRLAGCWRSWGEQHGYFDSADDAAAFYDETAYMLMKQMAAPNSPQWFNTGLNFAYGITGSSQGHYYVDPKSGELVASTDAYTHPQPHACARANTKLFTSEGILEIGDIVRDNRTDIQVFDGQRYAQVLAVKNNGVRSVYRATLKNGNYIEFTDDHRVWSADTRMKDGGAYSWNELQTLLGKKVQQVAMLPVYRSVREAAQQRKVAHSKEVYESVFASLDYPIEDFDTSEVPNNNASSLSLAKASLAGWIIGDGYYGKYNKNNKTTLFGAITVNDDEYAFVTNLFQQIFGEYRTVSKPEIHAEYRIVKRDSMKVDDVVREYELNVSSYTAKVPARIFTGTLGEQAAFLQSLFQADGCVRIRTDERNSGDVVLTTISEELAHGVQMLLLNLGIYSNVSTGRDARQDRKMVYQVSISYYSERKKYQQMIGFISRDKQEKLAWLNKEIIGKTKSSLSEETVISIEYIGDEEVFDIQTESAQFSANGVIVHNCFIQSVEDDLVNEGGIFDLVTREARIFKYGSGTGTNFSTLRGVGEKLSGGGTSSGLMSFLKIYDRAAGAIKSGGTTRRAAKMVILNADHPDIETFIEWKTLEEEKVAALVAGSKAAARTLQAVMDAALQGGSEPKENAALASAMRAAVEAQVPHSYIFRTIALVQQGFTTLNFAEFDTHYESEAYNTVSGQNSNNTVRVTNEFMQAVVQDKEWHLTYRTNGTVAKTVKARDLWRKIAVSAWKSADPGLQYDTTINEWHTCPADGRINASNPCSEYMFLDNTACNLASLNLAHFVDEKGNFLVDDFRHGARIWTIILEISVLMAQFPSKQIAELSYKFRTLGLGYANLGTILMTQGIPYDSPKALAQAGAISALMTGEAYATSAEIAREQGAFTGFAANREAMLRVMRNHRRAAYNMAENQYEGLSIKPMGINHENCPPQLAQAAREVWDRAVELGEAHGYRNAQTTVIAPTGTIGLVMDCDTTGVEPDFAIVKFKKLAGGGYFKIVNQSVQKALIALGYTSPQIEAIEKYCKGHGTLTGCPHINRQSLREKGFTAEKLEAIEHQLDGVFDVKFAFNKWALGEEFCYTLGFTAEQLNDHTFDMLKALGFTKEQLEEANEYICGTMTVEGAPFLKDEHLAVFDCANKCGAKGERYIAYMAHVRMMAAVQPFVSGAISKTVNMPGEATIDEVASVYMESWKLGVKANALYRDGSKLSQPLNSTNAGELDEILMLGNDDTLDETLGPKDVQVHIVEKVYHRAQRRRLPKKRDGHIREAHVGGHKVFLRTGEFEDGTLGEIFIDMYKEGASFKGLMNCFAVLASKALQYGMPLDELVETFTFTRFEPAGIVEGHEAIKNATSILDYVFRSVGYDYLKRNDFVHVKAVDETPEGIPISGKSASPELSLAQVPMLAAEPVEMSMAMSNGNTMSNGNGNGNGNGGRAAKIVEAKAKGYTGEQCFNCGSMRVKRNGSCTVCDDCGTTSGCS
jgi:ribonucleoside-diphosphate reductase alpha chain